MRINSEIRQIMSKIFSVSRQILQSLVVSLLSTRLRYGNATLAGVASAQLDRLRSAACDQRSCVQRGSSITSRRSLLRDLHWPYGCHGGSRSNSLWSSSVACVILLRHIHCRGGSRSRDWRGPYGERAARAYNGSLGAVPPARSMGRAPGQGSGGEAPWIWTLFGVVICL